MSRVMSPDSNLKSGVSASVAVPATSWTTSVGDYLELTKPRLTFLVLVTTFVGFCMAAGGAVDWVRLAHTIIGTGLVSGGALALNQFIERERDARMKRTRDRPLPAGRLQPCESFWFGLCLGVAGSIYLMVGVNLAAASLALASLLGYLFAYTPLKPRTTWCTLVGAFPGAMPPLIGWAAAADGLALGAWVLFGVLFLWQMPHFYALSQMYREDYAQGGFRMLSLCGPLADRTAFEIRLFTTLLVPVSLLPVVLGMNGILYAVGAALLGGGFLFLGWKAAWLRNLDSSRRLFLGSIFYLPFLLTLMVATRSAI